MKKRQDETTPKDRRKKERRRHDRRTEPSPVLMDTRIASDRRVGERRTDGSDNSES